MREEAERLPGLLPGERTDAISIAALYARVQGALARALPRARPVWVRGEIQSISDRTGHCYIDLVDPDAARGRDTPVLKVTCWSRTWSPLKASLYHQGIALEPGTVVTLQGRVELYAPRAQINFVATDVDVTALLGRQAATRAALLKSLESEGLLAKNRSLVVPAVPIVVGLVASRGTEGFRDFTGQLETSAFGFTVLHVPVRVQGSGAPKQIVAALSALFAAGSDLAVIVRGGGSKGDLAVFDAESVARAIANAPIPVWTGIGHTGDQSVADVVANRSFVTPTECGQEIVDRVGHWWSEVADVSEFLAQRASGLIVEALDRDSTSRARLCGSARSQLSRHTERLRSNSARVATSAPRCLELASVTLGRGASRIGPAASAQLKGQVERITSWRRLIAAYDVERQLERGYTMTLDENGRIIRSVGSLERDSLLVTRFADGSTRSRVQSVTLKSERGVTSDTTERSRES